MTNPVARVSGRFRYAYLATAATGTVSPCSSPLGPVDSPW